VLSQRDEVNRHRFTVGFDVICIIVYDICLLSQALCLVYTLHEQSTFIQQDIYTYVQNVQ
jgi:hypothetical protein